MVKHMKSSILLPPQLTATWTFLIQVECNYCHVRIITTFYSENYLSSPFLNDSYENKNSYLTPSNILTAESDLHYASKLLCRSHPGLQITRVKITVSVTVWL